MIVVLGSINIDLVAWTRRLPRPGETVAGHAFSIDPGGKGANQALAARRAGANVRLVAAVGVDGFAETAMRLLSEAGVDLSAVRRVDETTGSALISVGDDGENAIIVIPGANEMLTSEHAGSALESMAPGDVLVLQLEAPFDAVECALTLARGQGITTILNIAPFISETPRLAKLADIVIANESEFRLLIGDNNEPVEEFEAALRKLHAATGGSFIVTLGAEGAIAIWEGQIHRAPGLKINPVDTVGAGDTFCGYIAAGLSASMPFPRTLERAAIAGSLACLGAGAQRAIPFAAEVEECE